MKPDVFQQVVDEVLAELPPDLHKALDQVQIVVQDSISRDLLDRIGLPPDEELYGLFDGVALPDKSSENDQTFPDRVFLYRKCLEEDFPKRAELKQEIRVTLIHDLGHFFGMDEEEIEKRGYA